MDTPPIPTLLLFSLPASGKSELRRYMASLSPERCREDFGMGPTLQLDDYPYVHLMHRADDEIRARGGNYVFYHGPDRPFQDRWTWAVLIELLNEDFANLAAGRQVEVQSAGQHLLERLDAARAKVGLHEALSELPHRVWKGVAQALESECRKELDVLNRQNATGMEGRTVVIEAARGGANGSAFPLTPPQGYETAFQHLSPEILETASLLYIWVEPEESRRKNIERGRPDGKGSILHHSVPMEVMLGEYGCDDMAWLLSQSGRPGTIRVERTLLQDGAYVSRTYKIPAARFDNRRDLTTFIREPRGTWRPGDIEALHQELKAAFRRMGTSA